jgi:CRP-like cAMP-binding protein
MDSNKTEFVNTLLKSLGPRDLIEISKVLEPVRLDRMTFIEKAGAPASQLYFIEDGIVSTVARRGKREVEIAVTGREGVTGTALILGADMTPHDCYMQVAGSGYRLSVVNLRRLMAESQTLTATLLRYVNAFLIQVEWNAHANGIVNLQQRLARWLLMIHDRTHGNRFDITHEFLSIMLSARRPGVTVALQIYEGEGLIRATRGAISILDRQGLIEASDGSYGRAELEYQRLIGPAV